MKRTSASLTSPSPPSTGVQPLIKDIPQFRVVQVDIAVIHTYVSTHAISNFGMRSTPRSTHTSANYQDADICVLAPDRTGRRIPAIGVPAHVGSFRFSA